MEISWSLKPLQRMSASRVKVIPRIRYELVLEQLTLGYLIKVDRIIKSYVRKWLFLPHDCPNAFVHSKVEDGGLGILYLI